MLRFYQAAGAKALAVALAEARQDLIEGLQGFDPRYPQCTSIPVYNCWFDGKFSSMQDRHLVTLDLSWNSMGDEAIVTSLMLTFMLKSILFCKAVWCIFQPLEQILSNMLCHANLHPFNRKIPFEVRTFCCFNNFQESEIMRCN